MRAIIQRVRHASVEVSEEMISKIDKGLLILLGVESDDDNSDAEWLADKISRIRVFSDEEGKMNLDVNQIQGEALVVSQFTLHASTKKGNRPSFIKSAPPEKAEKLYLHFSDILDQKLKRDVLKGSFGAMMDVKLLNDGPVTIFMDSKNKE